MGRKVSSSNFLIVSVDPSETSSAVQSRRAAEQSKLLSFVQQKRRFRETRKPAERWTKFSSVLVLGDETSSQTAAQNPDPAHKSSKKASLLLPLASLYAPIKGNATDPFHATVAGETVPNDLAFSILRVSTEFPKRTDLAESFAPAWTVLNPRVLARHDAFFQKMARYALQDPVLYHATFASAASFMAWNYGHLDRTRPPEYFIGNAIQAIRERLADPTLEINDWLIVSIFTLAMTQYWQDVPELWSRCPPGYVAATKYRDPIGTKTRMHLRAVLGLVDQMGGWQRFSPYVVEVIIKADIYIALKEGIASSPLKASWDPGPVPPLVSGESRQRTDTLPRLGQALLRIPMHPDLHAMVVDIRDFVRIAENAWEDMTAKNQPQMNPELGEWLFKRYAAFKYRLMTFEGLEGQDLCILLAAQIFLFNASTDNEIVMGCFGEGLHIAIAAASSFGDNTFDQGLMLWCLCTAAMTASPGASRDAFFDNLGSLPDLPATVEAYSERLELYLFMPKRHTPLLSQMVDKLNIHRRSRLSASTD
ncbi:hypothetical protein QBC35DRAFT_453707 [Podospora australis]|uniref:Uncharacterized protein n=1 Tax=Podospora australis TaxID=1536484 RepID=A0AAN6WTD4_9PEZI|nr:hypothetical protein QBC35DRAFT_453707 [Podospora australis]